jgi:hypothetical protein
MAQEHPVHPIRPQREDRRDNYLDDGQHECELEFSSHESFAVVLKTMLRW